MAIVLIDGFDLYSSATATDTGLLSRWTYSGSTTTNLSMSTGRLGGQCLRQGNNTGNRCAHYVNLPSNYASFGIGFAFKYENLAAASLAFGSNTDFIGLYDTTTLHLALRLHSDGSIRAYRSTTSLGTSAAGVIVTDTWHYIELYGTIDDTTGSLTVYVDGTSVLTLSGIDTRNAANAYINKVEFGCPDGSGSNGISNHDDFYVTDSTTRVGERRIETLRPSADTASKAWTASTGSDNYAMVDDTTADGDTTYVQGSTTGDLDLYDFGNLSVTASSIDAVQLTAFAKKTDVSARSIYLPVKSGGTQSDGSATALGTAYDDIRRLMTTNPVSAAAWTQSDVDNLQAGLKVA